MVLNHKIMSCQNRSSQSCGLLLGFKKPKCRNNSFAVLSFGPRGCKPQIASSLSTLCLRMVPDGGMPLLYQNCSKPYKGLCALEGGCQSMNWEVRLKNSSGSVEDSRLGSSEDIWTEALVACGRHRVELAYPATVSGKNLLCLTQSKKTPESDPCCKKKSISTVQHLITKHKKVQTIGVKFKPEEHLLCRLTSWGGALLFKRILLNPKTLAKFENRIIVPSTWKSYKKACLNSQNPTDDREPLA